MRPRKLAAEWLLSGPSVAWLAIFFVAPTIMVFAMAFRPADPYGGLGDGWSLEAMGALFRRTHQIALWRTLWISAVSTVACLIMALPVAYWIARLPRRTGGWVLAVIIVPFWTNFLIRIYAWKTVLHVDGPLKQALVAVGLVDPGTNLLFNPAAVIVVLVYNYLPFAILPLYAAAERFDFGLLEAARDLGAGRWRALASVFVPGISRGVLTAFLVTFIPMLGSYAIPDIVGGASAEMIGNKIAQRVFADRNLPLASALASVLALLVLLPGLALMCAPRLRRGAGEGS